jgi:hypothetical protein
MDVFLFATAIFDLARKCTVIARNVTSVAMVPARPRVHLTEGDKERLREVDASHRSDPSWTWRELREWSVANLGKTCSRTTLTSYRSLWKALYEAQRTSTSHAHKQRDGDEEGGSSEQSGVEDEGDNDGNDIDNLASASDSEGESVNAVDSDVELEETKAQNKRRRAGDERAEPKRARTGGLAAALEAAMRRIVDCMDQEKKTHRVLEIRRVLMQFQDETKEERARERAQLRKDLERQVLQQCTTTLRKLQKGYADMLKCVESMQRQSSIEPSQARPKPTDPQPKAKLTRPSSTVPKSRPSSAATKLKSTNSSTTSAPRTTATSSKPAPPTQVMVTCLVTLTPPAKLKKKAMGVVRRAVTEPNF